ncbi:MAG: response regulator, partial [candidate division WOR-3 bacterium]
MPKLIAVVEDESDILELISLHLTKAGFRVETFPDGTGFYRFLDDRVPDLIVLDLMLPDIDGLDICKFLRNDPRYATIPIIMLTAKAEETDRVLGLELGADDYVTKPFSPRELVARVRAVL